MLETQPTKAPTSSFAFLSLTGSRFLRRLPAHQLLTGSGLFFLSTLLVNAGNYSFNLLLGRLLGPALFADVSLIITLFLFPLVPINTKQTKSKTQQIENKQTYTTVKRFVGNR